MDTTVVIPALYMLTGRNASGTDASVWYLLDWGQITRSVKSPDRIGAGSASAYCEGGEGISLSHRRAAQAETGPAFGVPEPDEVKVSCPVL